MEKIYIFFFLFNCSRTIIILFRISRVKIYLQLLSTILLLVTTSLSLSLFLLFDPTSVKYAKFVKRVINAVLLYTLTLQHL